MRDPLATEMEGGNVWQRPRPGDNVGTISQTIWMSYADHDIFVAGVQTTLDNGTARFTTNVWLGSSFVNKVCQFVQPGTKLTSDYIPGGELVAVTMTLQVYDV